MINNINIVIFLENQLTEQYKKISKQNKISNVDYIYNVSDLTNILKQNTDAIFILDSSACSENKNYEVFKKLHNNNIKFIYICKTFKDGFFVKKYNNSEIFLNSNIYTDNNKFIMNLCRKLTMLNKSTIELGVDFKQTNNNVKVDNIICIGSSTGGTELILNILQKLPKNICAPILIVQHMPPVFTKMYADRMNIATKVTVIEAEDGQQLLNGVVYVAPGGNQMLIKKNNNNYFISCFEPTQHHVNNPSVDVLFNSVAEEFDGNIIGVILTGMGKDGAKGLLKIKNKGGFTIGQDEKTSIVYGMPKAAYEIGAVTKQVPIGDIATLILENIEMKK